MAIVEHHEVICDRCAGALTRRSGAPALYPTRERAEDAMLRNGWTRDGEEVLCDDCHKAKERDRDDWSSYLAK